MMRRSGKGKKKKPVKITREDIENAMRDFEGEIQYLKVGDEVSFQSNTTQGVNPFGTRIVGGDHS